MSEPASSSQPVPMEERLSGTYARILRFTIALSLGAVVIATVLAGWRSGLGMAIGSLIAYVNFVALQGVTERLVERMLGATSRGVS